MDLGSIFLILALLILVVLFVSRPFFEHKAVSVSREEQEYSALQAERDRIINALQELDFDYSMGKIPEEDYPQQRILMLQRGADILRRLETYHGPAVRGAQSAKARLEAVMAVPEAAHPAPSRVVHTNGGDEADDDLEALIASRRRARQGKAGGFCPQCGGALQKSDMFCPKCGVGVER